MQEDQNSQEKTTIKETSSLSQPIAAPTNSSPIDQPAASKQTDKQGSPTKPANRNVFIVGFLLMILLAGLLFVINNLGLQTTDYSSASSYESTASVFGWMLAATTGTLLAYRATHPRKVKTQTTGKRYFLIVLGFIFGAIPGFIVAMIITYPLSQHACSLSGSKYC